MKHIFSISILVLLFLLLSGRSIFAANTTIEFSPSSGSFDKPFTTSLVIDGHGERFNAAEAIVTIPSNVKVESLVLGDCNFSFLKTPGKEQPSFQGVLLSQYATKCTVYTLTLVPVVKGEASVTLSKPSVKRFGDAADILSSVKNGKYTLTGTSQTQSTQTKTAKQTNNNLYSLTLNIFSKKDVPADNATVLLRTVKKENEIKGTTDDKGNVQFADVKSGVYSVIVEHDNKKVGETIINVSGTQRVLTLSIDLDAQKNNPLLKNNDNTSLINNIFSSPWFIGGILLIGVGLGFMLPRLIKKKA